RHFEHPEKHLPTASRTAHPPYLLPIPNLLHPSRYSKYIARKFQTGFLQVAVSKTLRRSIAKRSPTFSSPDRSRYSTNTSRKVPGKSCPRSLRTPYNRKLHTEGPRMFADQGYVVAVQDVRG